MLRLTLLITFITLACASLQGQWAVYKHQYEKTYGPEEELYRQSIFQANLDSINDHNDKYARGEYSYYLGVNQFTDMTTEEFSKKMNTYIQRKEVLRETKEVDVSDLPDTVDWRTKGYVTPVQDQGDCGSCYAFSSTGSMEGAHFKATGKLVKLSEQQVLDCSPKWGNEACGGGRMDYTFQYVMDIKGIDTETSYPYAPIFYPPRNCTFKKEDVGATISDFNTTTHTESSLQEAVANVGPISVAIWSNDPNFQKYAGGVYDNPHCPTTHQDHAILVVGYGTDKDSGKEYWLIKNSWATTWGIKGFGMMRRNSNNQCGIATDAIYPIV